jgi:uncharacterized protein (TIGR02271 family)
MRTVVGLFRSLEDAEGAIDDIAGFGLPANEVGLLCSQQAGGPLSAKLGLSSLDVPDIGHVAVNPPMARMLDAPTLQSPEGVLGALTRMGVPRDDALRYIDGVKRGGTLEAVVLDDDKHAQALDIMRRRAAKTNGNGASRVAADPDIVIPVIQEELSVGKREVEVGGVRVATHVTARPVAKSVTIVEEDIKIERRVVDRPITEADEAFRDRSLEVRASAEEPTITKRAHVVEEIRIHKDRTERVETVNDTLRHTDVQLSEVPGERRTERK